MPYIHCDGGKYYGYETTGNEFYMKYSVVLSEDVVQLKLFTETRINAF